MISVIEVRLQVLGKHEVASAITKLADFGAMAPNHPSKTSNTSEKTVPLPAPSKNPPVWTPCFNPDLFERVSPRFARFAASHVTSIEGRFGRCRPSEPCRTLQFMNDRSHVRTTVGGRPKGDRVHRLHRGRFHAQKGPEKTGFVTPTVSIERRWPRGPSCAREGPVDDHGAVEHHIDVTCRVSIAVDDLLGSNS